MSRVSTIDATGALVLKDAVEALDRRGIVVMTSGIRHEHRRALDSVGALVLLRAEGREYATTPDAVAAARRHLHGTGILPAPRPAPPPAPPPSSRSRTASAACPPGADLRRPRYSPRTRPAQRGGPRPSTTRGPTAPGGSRPGPPPADRAGVRSPGQELQSCGTCLVVTLSRLNRLVTAIVSTMAARPFSS